MFAIYGTEKNYANSHSVCVTNTFAIMREPGGVLKVLVNHVSRVDSASDVVSNYRIICPSRGRQHCLAAILSRKSSRTSAGDSPPCLHAFLSTNAVQMTSEVFIAAAAAM